MGCKIERVGVRMECWGLGLVASSAYISGLAIRGAWLRCGILVAASTKPTHLNAGSTWVNSWRVSHQGLSGSSPAWVWMHV